MKTVRFNADCQEKRVTDTQARLYQEMRIAVPILTEAEQEEFINMSDFDIGVEIQEEQMIPANMEFEDWFNAYQKKHFKKFGTFLYLKP